jgi:hypothetical protein
VADDGYAASLGFSKEFLAAYNTRLTISIDTGRHRPKADSVKIASRAVVSRSI